jgi:hypothetical protein
LNLKFLLRHITSSRTVLARALLKEIGTARDARVLLFCLDLGRARHGLDEPVEIEVANVGNAAARGKDTNGGIVGWLDDAVDGALDGVVAPAGE